MTRAAECQSRAQHFGKLGSFNPLCRESYEVRLATGFLPKHKPLRATAEGFVVN